MTEQAKKEEADFFTDASGEILREDQSDLSGYPPRIRKAIETSIQYRKDLEEIGVKTTIVLDFSEGKEVIGGGTLALINNRIPQTYRAILSLIDTAKEIQGIHTQAIFELPTPPFQQILCDVDERTRLLFLLASDHVSRLQSIQEKERPA